MQGKLKVECLYLVKEVERLSGSNKRQQNNLV